MPVSIGGRIPKIMMYLSIVGLYVKCEEMVTEDARKELYRRVVLVPFEEQKSSKCFYGLNEIRTMNRAY